MIPRLGDGNTRISKFVVDDMYIHSLENDSPSRGRKLVESQFQASADKSLENDSPSRGRKHEETDEGVDDIV